MNVVYLPDHRADLDPDGAAVSDGSRSLTNAQLLHRVRSASRHLKDLGVRPSDVVALQLTNRVEFVVLLFAAWRLGAAITPINPSLTDLEVDRQLTDSGARLLVAEDGANAHDGVAILAVGDLRQGLGWPDLLPPPEPSALALLIYTSGPAGLLEGVMLDHANLDAMAAIGRNALELGPADRYLLILPPFHVNGIAVSVLPPMLAGASVVITDQFDPRTIFDLIERERPTFVGVAPTIDTMLAALPPGVQPDTSSLQFGISGAAPAPADPLARCQAPIRRRDHDHGRQRGLRLGRRNQEVIDSFAAIGVDEVIFTPATDDTDEISRIADIAFCTSRGEFNETTQPRSTDSWEVNRVRVSTRKAS